MLNLDDPPERTALAFAVGVFIGFSPLLGLHTILATIVAVLWRLNKLAIFTAIYINNPWTLAPIIAASWAIGRLIIDTPAVELPQLKLGTMVTLEFWRSIAAQWHQLLPFTIGATILSVTGAVVSYPLMLYLLRAQRRARGALLAPESTTEKD